MSLDVDRPRPVPKARLHDPVFSVLDVEHVAHALAPTLRFQLHVSDPDGRAVHTIALSTQIQVDPARRGYDDATRARLAELFGAPERWGATTHSFQWARVDALVPGFTGATSFALELPCTYDLEVAASKYFYSLPDGDVPLSFHFSGLVLYRDGGDLLKVAAVPWACSARWSMPVAAWRAAIDACYPGGGWVRLSHETLDALQLRKAQRGDHSFDATVRELLDGEEAP
ncbi:DUF6084 family protein [Conexibacter stalactiti]|uniref:DUF6084 family protein n=1 Tax=Conexibacter stalactiti TaxID=1940611 RepID=A0ABU4HKM2_9ACTN|nr:DUF6084 family protein [Conexibacter stalactiti]MDW5593866.1 DUF6084 family protein [Conexibacter stalactiti]MEC5034508.1 DUF6084 family protein [Conexibacter stalactiti]